MKEQSKGGIDEIPSKSLLVEQQIYTCKSAGCTKIFKTLFALKRHSLTHTKEKNFACSICNKAFSLPQYLREHTNTHTDLKPYVCGVSGCEKSFRQAGKLSLHRRTHPEYSVKKYKYSLNPKAKRNRDKEEHEKQHNPSLVGDGTPTIGHESSNEKKNSSSSFLVSSSERKQSDLLPSILLFISPEFSEQTTPQQSGQMQQLKLALREVKYPLTCTIEEYLRSIIFRSIIPYRPILPLPKVLPKQATQASNMLEPSICLKN